jgi:hypothetical protein
MSGSEALLQIAQAAGFVGQVGQGFADRATGQAQADIYRTQGRYAVQDAATEETLYRRSARSEIAQQTANVLAEGGGDGSQLDVVRQNEVNLIADALAIRRKGQIAATGYESRAKASEYEGDQALFGSVASAGSKFLMTTAERKALERRAAVGVR